MGKNRVKTFYDITARRWNDIINAVNSCRPADSIYPPLEEHELAEFRKMERQKAEADRHGGCPLIFDNVEYDFDDPLLDIYSTPVSSDINYTDMDGQNLPLKLKEAIRFAEEKQDEGKKRLWRIRKEEDLARMRESGLEVKQIVMADSISHLQGTGKIEIQTKTFEESRRI